MRIRQLDRRTITIPEQHCYSESNRFGSHLRSIACSQIHAVYDAPHQSDHYLIEAVWGGSVMIPKQSFDDATRAILEELMLTTKSAKRSFT